MNVNRQYQEKYLWWTSQAIIYGNSIDGRMIDKCVYSFHLDRQDWATRELISKDGKNTMFQFFY